jgi:polyphosphate kinase
MHVIHDEPLDSEADLARPAFPRQIFPVLTPQAIVRPPLPVHSQQGTDADLQLKKGRSIVRELIMAPPSLPRFVRMPGDKGRYIALETLIRRKTDYLFPKYEVLRGGAFRIIRDSDIEVEEEAEDLVRFFRTAIKQRRRGRVVRLELEPGMPESLVNEVALDAVTAITSETPATLDIRCQT